MPIYEYQCSQCSHIEDYHLGISHEIPSICKSCGIESPLIKLVSLSSFKLSGKGFYSTDYTGKSMNSTGGTPYRGDITPLPKKEQK